MLLLAVPLSVSAFTVSSINPDTNKVAEWAGSIMVDIDAPGIMGTIDVIRSDGDLVWQAGDGGLYLSFFTGDYATTSTTVVGTQTVYTASGGFVEFYANSFDAFSPHLDYASAVDVMDDGELFLSADSEGDSFGLYSPLSYTSNGFLSVTGGSLASVYDTDMFSSFTGGIADLTFNLSADNIHGSGVHADYDYSGSDDANSFYIEQIPTPAPVAMIGLGLLGLGVVRKLK